MTIEPLLAKLETSGVRLRKEGDRLVASVDRELLDDSLLHSLREHKPALLAMIEGEDWWSPPLIRPEMLPLLELAQQEINAIADVVPGGAANIQDIYPLAPLQEGILFHHLLAAEGDPYQTLSFSSFDTAGRLHAYLDALRAVIQRHDILRTSVHWEELREPVQVVWRAAPLAVEEVELDPAHGEAARQLYERFDPRLNRIDVRVAPLIRACIARDAARGCWVLLLRQHHLLGDRVTSEVLKQEVRAHLSGRAHELPAPLPFRDYVAQTRLGASREQHEAYFARLLADVEEPTAPFGMLDVWRDGSGIAEARADVEGDLAARVGACARALGVSAASIWHVAWAQVLARVSGREDVVFGTVLLGRMHGGAGADRVLGPFLNTLPVRVRLGPVGAAAAVRSTHTQLTELLRHEHASLALAQRCSGVAAPAPLFTSLLNYRRHGAGAAEPEAAETAGRSGGTHGGRTNYPLTVAVDDRRGRFSCKVKAPASVGPARVCAMILQAIGSLVEALEAAPEREVRSLEVLPGAERARVVEEWNRTRREYPLDRCVHELFEAQVARTPDAVAVASGAETLSYAELNRRSNRLAHLLIERGVGPDGLVALCVERSVEMVVGVMAVLKAGGAYLPLDPEYPAERLLYMLADSRPGVVLTQRSLRERFAGTAATVVALDEQAHARADLPDANPERPGLGSDHLAYVIYTSGSTGRAKGVMNQHRTLVNRLLWAQEAWPLAEDESLLLRMSLSFDGSVRELFWPLSVGARVVLAPTEESRDPASLLDRVRREAITTLNLVPSLLQALTETSGLESCTTLRRVLCGGEALHGPLLRGFRERLPRVALHNLYGPSEAATAAAALECAAPEANGSVPIGRPVANTRLYVLDREGQPVPAGVAGELYIGGAGVARGYLGRAGLTAERFVADPFGREPGGRLYRTGDLCVWRSEGELEFVGRIDFQVKVRGFRVEPGEIEARLLEHGAVREAVVQALGDTPQDSRLVAYYTGEEVGAEVLREHLEARLPEYMVPSAYVHLGGLPLTPSGKLDRKALPAPGGGAYARRGYEAPAGDTEVALAEIWAEVLGVERVGRRDDFFRLGGQSLLAIRLIERMRRRGLRAEIRALFATPTLAELAAAVNQDSVQFVAPANRIPTPCGAILPEMLPLVELSQEEIDRVVAAVDGGAANVQDVYPLAPLQEGLLFHHLLTTRGDPYVVAGVTAFDSREGLDAYLDALQQVVDRHDVLRTSIAWEGLREPVQVVWRRARLQVEHVDDESPDPDAAKRLLARFDPREHRIDLGRAPLMRACVAPDAHHGRWLLLLLRHHLISDHTSKDVLKEEIQAHLLGHAGELPPPQSFREYVAQARLGGARPEHEAYFRGLLGDVEEPTAPFGLLDVWHDGSGVEEAASMVEHGLAVRLRARARELGVSPASICHVAWAQVLSCVSGRDDVVFGTLLLGRMQHGEGADRVMGPFINTLPVRARLGRTPAAAAVRQMHAQLLELMRHEHASLALAQRCSRVQAPTPLFTALLNYRHGAGGGKREDERRPRASGFRTIEGVERTNYPVTLSLGDRGVAFSLKAQVPARVGARRVCDLVHRSLESLVEALETRPGRALEDLQTLPDAERAQVIEGWNATAAEYPAQRCVHELFEMQAERTPDAVAVVHEHSALSYAELNRRANRLAHHLRERGVGPDVRVALCLERGLDMVVGVLAVLKAGGAYVPLDPSYPAERLGFMLRGSAPAVLLTQATWAGRFGAAQVPLVVLDRDASSWETRAESNPERTGVRPDHLVYVIYTSGSTGQPKGVMNVHRNLVNRLASIQAAWRLEPGESVLQTASLSFDVSAYEILWPLSLGGRVVLPRGEGSREPAYLVEVIRSERVGTVSFVPSLLRLFLEQPEVERCTTLVRCPCGGEALSLALVERFYARLPWARLYNRYGPSEAATAVTGLCRAAGETEREVGSVPIGRPGANTRVYVLDGRTEPVPVGVVGELYIGGAGVGRGYLGRPELTAERFVADPFSAEPGARLYRTGDLARWRADGTVEFLGRNDFQVKLRGLRVEPGEIEARLREHPQLREAVVVVREDAPGDQRLVAYYVGEEVGAEGLRVHLSERLPEYMVPAAYVRLEALPLTPSGKLDRKALPIPDSAAYERRGYEAPASEAEAAMVEIWSELLRVERVGRWEHFFELGGHSLLAVQVVSRVRQVLGVEVALGEVFTRPVLADFARGLEQAPRAELPAIEPVERGDRLALSFAQQRLWFLEQMGNLGGTYHVGKRLRFRGGLDGAALVRALERVVARHETLRTVFPQVDGEPVQRILPPEESRFHLLRHDLRGRADPEAELARLTAEEAGAPFDLERGPLVRGRLVRVAADDHVLLLTLHHIVSDGWSTGVLARELSALYAALRRGEPDPLPPLPVQYADYAAWQRRWVDGEVLRRQAEYWKAALAGAPELLELPTDHPRPAKRDHAGAALAVALDEPLTAGLRALGERHGTTPFMTLLAAWAVVLGRLSGQEDVVVGTPTANRGRRELEGLIGFFVNTLALRVDLSGSPTVGELLGRVKERALGAQQNQDIPFEQVVELVQPERSLAHTPLFQAWFAWESAARNRLELPDLARRPLAQPKSHATAKFDISLGLREQRGRIVGRVEYATSLFERATVERYAGYLRRVLEGMAADDGAPVGSLGMLSAAERTRLLHDWNRTGARFAGGWCVHERFEAQAERFPDAVAVEAEAETLSYGELNRRANSLAHYLVECGVGPDVRVGVALERGMDVPVALLAVLKAGGAYVPLDPSYPEERLRYMLADSRPAVLLAHPALAERFAGSGVRVVALDGGAPAWADRPATNPARAGLTADHLVYVIYTSGSTGEPKGVMNLHRNLDNRVCWMQAEWRLDPRESVLQNASLSFDVSAYELFWPLATGARAVLTTSAGQKDPAYLVDTVRTRRIGTMSVVPSMLQLVLEQPGVERCTDLLRVPCGGEALPPPLVRRFYERLPRARLYNRYGPSEAATAVTGLVPPAAADGAAVPIGRPVANARVYVLDASGEPVPAGVAGELYIGGAGVGRGYLGRVGLTAARFVPDPFGGEAGARMYRTGDLARWLPEGAVEFLGRNDAQVKVRGFRVEPGEIEARLAEHAAVREAAVVARDDAPGGRRLVAYYAPKEGRQAAVEELREHLRLRLPEYMVPAAYVRMERLPLTPSGKLDRRALPAPTGDAFARQAHEAPATALEASLAEIWAEVLGVERVGRWDHFFGLGGHSLLAVRVVSRVRELLELKAGLAELFERPVLAEFARGLEAAERGKLPPIEPVGRDRPLPLSFAQQRLWFLEQLGGTGSAYRIRRRLRIRGDLDRGALLRALDRVVARHEALRTTFVVVQGEPTQRVHPPEESRFCLAEHDVSESADPRAELRRLMEEEDGARFDLERGPLIRGRLVRLASDDHVLLLAMHHIVSDGWSMSVLMNELSALYAAFRHGDADPLPPLRVQYPDFAAWQRRWIDGEVMEAQAKYWSEALAGAPDLLELPTDHPRPARQDHQGAWIRLALGPELTTGLKGLSRRRGTTLFMTLLAGWAVVLSRLAGQDDVVVGTPSANRGRRETENLIGFFLNMLALRVGLHDSPTVDDLLRQVRKRTLEAQQNQDIPFEQVVELVQPVRSLAHSPLFQVMFVWQNNPGATLELPGLALEAGAGASHVTAKYDLSLSLLERGGQIRGHVEYATSLFEPSTAERYAGYLRRVLEAMAADEHRPVDRLPMLAGAERAQLVEEWNRTAEAYPGEECLHDLFEAQAARTPDAVAVVHEGQTLTYAGLDRMSNRLAHRLIARGVGPGVRVGVCVSRSPGMLVALFGVLKAGGTYVPLDPSYPEERLRYMVEDGAPEVLLVQRGSSAPFRGLDVPVVDLDVHPSPPSPAADTRPARRGLTPDHIAYVIYTSGSTGRPKGVQCTHRGVLNLVRWYVREFAITASDAVLIATSFSFDLTQRHLFGPLFSGGSVHLAGDPFDAQQIVRQIAAEGVTMTSLTPTALRALLEAARGDEFTRMRLIVQAGEAPEVANLLRLASPRPRFANVYGPTECSGMVACHHLPAELEACRAGPVPVGRPISNARIYVLDRAGEPVPTGVVGEIHIGGAPVGAGYLDRPALTAEKFVADPFGEPGGRLYRTGDLGRWRPDGTLVLTGRNDFQVKVRGIRIELGEIEARIAEHEGVRDAVVVARDGRVNGKRLVAYYVAGETVEAEALRAHLRRRLPDWSIPSACVRLDAMPKTPSGKVDRRALPEAPDEVAGERPFEPPVGETETMLAGIWKEVLGLDRVGRDDHFFDRGGNSLVASKLTIRIREYVGVGLPLRAVFEHPVLASLAHQVVLAQLAEFDPAELAHLAAASAARPGS
jgi:amino acid adenylation domain-containing protein